MNYFRSSLISKITQKSFIITLDSPSKYNGVTPHPHPSAAWGGVQKGGGEKSQRKSRINSKAATTTAATAFQS